MQRVETPRRTRRLRQRAARLVQLDGDSRCAASRRPHFFRAGEGRRRGGTAASRPRRRSPRRAAPPPPFRCGGSHSPRCQKISSSAMRRTGGYGSCRSVCRAASRRLANTVDCSDAAAASSAAAAASADDDPFRTIRGPSTSSKDRGPSEPPPPRSSDESPPREESTDRATDEPTEPAPAEPQPPPPPPPLRWVGVTMETGPRRGERRRARQQRAGGDDGGAAAQASAAPIEPGGGEGRRLRAELRRDCDEELRAYQR